MSGAAVSPAQQEVEDGPAALHAVVHARTIHLSIEQWTGLLSGKPDEETFCILEGLMSDLISYFSCKLGPASGNPATVSEEQVLACVDAALSDIFAEFFDVTEPSVTLEKLKAMIVREVTDRIHAPTGRVQPAGSGRTSPRPRVDLRRLRSMATLTCHISYTTVIMATTAATEERKMLVLTLVDKLVTKIFIKAKACEVSGHAEDTIMRLFDKTWAEVENMDFKVSKGIFKTHDRLIFNKLVKKYGGVKTLLTAIQLGDPKSDSDIVSAIKHLLAQPKQSVPRFFSSVGMAITNIFRRRNRVGVV